MPLLSYPNHSAIEYCHKSRGGEASLHQSMTHGGGLSLDSDFIPV